MGRIAYLTKRGAVWWYRRRYPVIVIHPSQNNQISVPCYDSGTSLQARGHLAVSLRTRSKREARILGAFISADFERAWAMIEAVMNDHEFYTDMMNAIALTMAKHFRSLIEKIAQGPASSFPDGVKLRAYRILEQDLRKALGVEGKVIIADEHPTPQVEDSRQAEAICQAERNALKRTARQFSEDADEHDTIGISELIEKLITGDRLYDVRRDKTCWRKDGQGDVLHWEVVGPDGSWDWTLAELWNGAEGVAKKINERPGRQSVIALPYELCEGGHEAAQRVARSHCLWLRDQYGIASTWALHAPNPEAYGEGAKNWHIHIVETDRRMTVCGAGRPVFGAKVRELTDAKQGKVEIERRRKDWKKRDNAELQRVRANNRVNLGRKPRGDGPDYIPGVHRGPKVNAILRKHQAATRGHDRGSRLAADPETRRVLPCLCRRPEDRQCSTPGNLAGHREGRFANRHGLCPVRRTNCPAQHGQESCGAGTVQGSSNIHRAAQRFGPR
ncbi:MobA/MobL family protein [Thioclava litoralis]|uniref:MobA/MobL family protein n=1 Tax=Thioclava litoralis TaxID=3076557 RepID=A0ABZ1DXR4_9RHOB|nr:MobA/MobL family protein [Thioclava sp. FTW29]